MKWIECTLGDILNFRRGYDLPHSEMSGGDIPVAGSNGVIGYHNKATDISPVITIGRSGNVGTPYIYDRAWAHNTTLFIDDFKGNDPLYLYYLIKTLPLASFGGGSAVPTLNRNHIHPFIVKHCPDVEEQKRIASFLKAFDDTIELNNRINHNLEEQAGCLISSAIETQAIGKAHLWDICSYVSEKVNCDTLNNENYISTENMLANRGGIGIALTIPGGKCTSFKVRDVLVSNIRPYFKKIWMASFSGGCSNDVLCFRTTTGTSSFLYYLLRSDAFFEYVMSGVKGSKMPRGDKQHILNWEIPVFEKQYISSLECSLEVIDDRVAIIQEENRRLGAIRDSLLPMLMTNSISIKDLTC